MAEESVIDSACVYDIVLNGDVIYVGMTGDPKGRFNNHRYTGIAPEGAAMSIHKWYDTRRAAFKAETERQNELQPERSDRRMPERSPYDPEAYAKAVDELNKRYTADDIQAYIEDRKKGQIDAANFEREWKAKNESTGNES